MPPNDFEWPFQQKTRKKVYFRRNHITGLRYGCFILSQNMNGVLCVPCILFSTDNATNNRGKVTALGQLVETPLRKYGHLTGADNTLNGHLQTAYHKTAQTFADNFLIQLGTGGLATRLDKDRKRQLADDQRHRLIPIVKTVILCRRQGLAYRGRRDNGTIDLDKPISVADGNFHSLLAFRVDSGDEELKNNLLSTGKNCTYISKTTQNELIEICGEIVAENILSNIRRAEYYSILCDKTTDSSHHEQLCLCMRFVHEAGEKHSIREEFLQFKRAEDLMGAGLASQIISLLESTKLSLVKLVGKGYDGASSMSGVLNGVQACVGTYAPLADYVHCSSHALNLVLNKASLVPEV